MAVLGWGKCRILVKNLEKSDAKWKELPTPAENTTALSVTKGDKKEAKLEGGETEDVRYNKNAYALAYSIRAAKGRKRPFTDEDGLITDNYAVAVVPEDPTCIGLMIDKSRVSVEDGFSTDEGGIWTYTHDALKPASGKMCKWGTINVTGTGDNISAVTITEAEDE